MKLDGKVAVITGASSGIGAETARLLLAEGARLVVTGRRADRLEALGAPERVACLPGEITDPGLPARLLGHALERFGRCDICFNNAGVVETGSLAEIDLDKVAAMVRINVEAAFRVMYTFARHFQAQDSGHLVSTSSVLGTKVRPMAGAYCGTKFAIEALSEALRLELARTRVKVSCVEPGLVLTELHRDYAVHPKDSGGIDEPLRPRDVAEMVLVALTQPDHVLIPRIMILPKAAEV